ncbi:hypothetical protein BDZ94DRAFT_1270720 [Collybia nuda]|uniref:Uncharacterized protein n=1 Tax=Collybia nuda TaxID=64659 RepID=A0A9P5XX58_9AGAR|nr:hypothetical protein BDZ94DRAFT_1270720 [Collybia nuda]
MARIYIDDQDLSKVAYTGTWVKGGSPYEHEETVASSTNVGDYFIVTFKGTSVAVYGTFDSTSEGVIATYSVDGAPATRVTTQGGSGDTHRQQFWRSSQLSLAEHKLNVTMVKVNYDPQPGEGTVWFDYFLVTDPTITSFSGPNPSPTQPLIAKPQTSTPVGAMVGGIIGGLFFLLAVICLLVFYRRRKRTLRQEMSEKPNDDITNQNIGSIRPFLLGRGDLSLDSSLESRGRDSGTHISAALAVLPSRKSLAMIRPVPDITHPPGLSIEPSSSDRSSTDHPVENSRDPKTSKRKVYKALRVDIPPSPQSPSTSEQQPPTRQHVDSGVRVQAIQTLDSLHVPSPVELPPVYSPA